MEQNIDKDDFSSKNKGILGGNETKLGKEGSNISSSDTQYMMGVGAGQNREGIDQPSNLPGGIGKDDIHKYNNDIPIQRTSNV